MSNHTTRQLSLAELTHKMNPQEGVKVTVEDAAGRTVSGSVQFGSCKADRAKLGEAQDEVTQTFQKEQTDSREGEPGR